MFIGMKGYVWLPCLHGYKEKHHIIVYCSALKGGVSGWECNPILEAVKLFIRDRDKHDTCPASKMHVLY